MLNGLQRPISAGTMRGMDAGLDREELEPLLPALADLLLTQLKLRGTSGRVEIEYRGGPHLSKLYVHEGFSRNELAELERPSVPPAADP